MHATSPSRAIALALFALTAAAALPGRAGDSGTTGVVVNGTRLRVEQVRMLERQYLVRILDGRYWYDAVSGAWGFEGGPTVGQIYPGLGIGGPIRANASGGGTGVFINGRELHALDVAALQRCTTVYRGRYWVNAQGVGGIEGGPPLFNLALLCAPPQRSSSSGRTFFNEDGSWSYRNDLTGISMISTGR